MHKTKSIVTEYLDYCLICGKPKNATHHLLSGTANRRLCDKDNAIIPLCYEHHVGKMGIHTLREMEVMGKIIGQLAWERRYALDKLAKANLELAGCKPGEIKNGAKEERERLEKEARDEFRSRYGKSFL